MLVVRVLQRMLPSLVLCVVAGAASDDVPQAVSIQPRVVKPGTVVTVTGVALEKEKVDDAYLTDLRFDLKVKVLEQSATSMKFRVPPFIKPGRHQLLLQTTGDAPKLLEQPVFVTVEADPKAAAQEVVADKDKSDSKSQANLDKR